MRALATSHLQEFTTHLLALGAVLTKLNQALPVERSLWDT